MQLAIHVLPSAGRETIHSTKQLLSSGNHPAPELLRLDCNCTQDKLWVDAVISAMHLITREANIQQSYVSLENQLRVSGRLNKVDFPRSQSLVHL